MVSSAVGLISLMAMSLYACYFLRFNLLSAVNVLGQRFRTFSCSYRLNGTIGKRFLSSSLGPITAVVVVVVTLFYIDLFLQKYCFSSQLYTYVQAN